MIGRGVPLPALNMVKALMSRHPITLAQISDLHLPSYGWTPPHYWNLKRGLGSLNWHRKRRFVHRLDVASRLADDIFRQHPAHVAVTGDLVNIGLPREFRASLRWLERLGKADKVMVIPGNHDIYSKLSGDEMCHVYWGDYMESDDFGRALAAELGQSEDFPIVRRVGNVALVGVNSAEPTPPFVAAGRVGESQRMRLARSLSALKRAGLIRVVLIHHPPLPGMTSRRRALKDSEEMRAVLKTEGAELVLHGHNHLDAVTWLETASGSIPVCSAASGSAGRKLKDEPLARYYLYKIGGTPAAPEIERTVRGLNDSCDAVVELDRSRLQAAAPGHVPRALSGA